MRITRVGDARDEPMEAANFSGAARRRDLGRTPEPDAAALVVTFEPGARTHWHRHAGGQVLYVLAGQGRVATHDEEADLAPGDFVYAAPGEEHWHGAGGSGAMSHIALSFGETSWGDAVDD